MMPPTSIDGTDITGATIDGTDVTEITVDGDTVFSAVKIVDDFEDGNLNEYVGDTGSFSFSSSTVFSGTNSLELPAGQGGILSDSGLANYPSMGDTFEVYLRFPGTDDMSVSYGTDGSLSGTVPNDGYSAQIATNGFVALLRRDGGSRTFLTKSSGNTIPINTWLRLEIEWVNDNHTMKLFNNDTSSQITTLTTTDSTYSSNDGIAFKAGGSGGGGGFIDLMQII